MADRENTCVRLTRAAKKRKVAAMAEVEMEKHQQVGKKRVVLGELKNLANAVVSLNPNLGKETQKPKNRVKAVRAKKALIPVVEEKKPAAVDIDAKSDDPQMCSAYAKDIFDYLLELEAQMNRKPLPDYLENVQKDVTANMRGVLVDWLVDVADEYRLLADTLYLTVTYIDRFLSRNVVNKQRLQLLGVSSMFIASKYEEIKPPPLEEFCYITDNTYTKEEVLKMESDLLSSLRFELGSPTIITFLRRFTRVSLENDKNPNSQLEFLGRYLAELSLLDYNCIKFLPSVIAASAIFLARFITQPNTHPWTCYLQEFTGYRPSDLKESVTIIHDLYMKRRGGGLHAVREKYTQDKFEYVATMASPPEVPGCFFEDVIL